MQPEPLLVTGAAIPDYPLTEESEMLEISLTQKQMALIDDEDFVYISPYKWHVNRSHNKNVFYAASTIRRRDGKQTLLLMHRLIMNAKIGEIVDHINHDTLNNQKSNLRICTNSENRKNSNTRCDSVSGIKGIYWDKRRNKWQSHIKINGKHKHLGFFERQEDAYAVYCEAVKNLHGEFACFG